MNHALFINTRPTHRNICFHHLSCACVELPLLRIDDVALSNDEQAIMRDLITQNPYQALIITSVESAKRAICFLRHLGISTACQLPNAKAPSVIAVGEASAKVLKDFGFVVVLPTTANNEGMLKLPQIQNLQASDKVLIWRGVGGRRLLEDDLANRQIQIDVIEWYERTKPHDLADNYHAITPQIDKFIMHNQPVIMLISSQMAFENWQSLRSTHAHRIHYLTLGDRLFDIVRTAYPKARTHLIDALSAQHVQDVIDDIIRSTNGVPNTCST
ncbi:uroporphyrinogen-III synthase [Moraxella nasovis]|uniref:uroporphyrinogen-III synthase n=1 Tax=Moraxella nasovis TaxID=2904121 RepID=UPI001F602122|nr:uroporphyrinogen-III synthase [Moraxella nasovis]UNU74217.1 uroporphyrinogen-III synthase [Moraxella nasovis]